MTILSIHDPAFIDIHNAVYERLTASHGLQFQESFEAAFLKGRVEAWQTQALRDATDDLENDILKTYKKHLKFK